MTHAYWTKAFWLATGERAIKSLAQGVIVAWVGSEIGTSGPANLYDFDLAVAAGAGGGMALLSILFSVASAPVGINNGPSLTTEKVTEDA
jgi:hypothetical protein